jgi:hypothetical protein
VGNHDWPWLIGAWPLYYFIRIHLFYHLKTAFHNNSSVAYHLPHCRQEAALGTGTAQTAAAPRELPSLVIVTACDGDGDGTKVPFEEISC